MQVFMPVTTVFAGKGAYCRKGQNLPKKDVSAGIAGNGTWVFHALFIHYPYLGVAWEWEELYFGCEEGVASAGGRQ